MKIKQVVEPEVCEEFLVNGRLAICILNNNDEADLCYGCIFQEGPDACILGEGSDVRFMCHPEQRTDRKSVTFIWSHDNAPISFEVKELC
jgi:hypothetical protein